MKTCAKCKQLKILEEFILDNRRKDGRGSWCRICHRSTPSFRSERKIVNCIVCNLEITSGRTDKQYCSNECGHKFRSRKYSLKKYGVTPEEYFEQLRIQDYKCAICQQPETIKNTILAQDHCHESGQSRGLLCNKCNTGLGLFGDNITKLQAAINYLNEHGVKV